MRLTHIIALASLALTAALASSVAFVKATIVHPLERLLSAFTFAAPYRHHDHLIAGHPRSPRYAA
ncbi:hypothetical protein K9B35_14210 [Sphingomonas sp. R647]|uniref:hypothetical protein n=1 Tax=Sphingomonas sp. R647 TaxID=2875233 RepID=UPI001CD6C7A5|nr:hypothetical protein [Sphingomonas sp. R647]MCA1199127.1 hypothetical protein [Sphingomonas sp. R647]